MSLPSVKFLVREHHGHARKSCPVRIGLPLAEGTFREDQLPNVIIADDGESHACQCKTISHWPSGSPRWMILSANVSLAADEQAVFTATHDSTATPNLNVDREVEHSVASAGSEELFRLRASTMSEPITTKLRYVDSDGAKKFAVARETTTFENGPICFHHQVRGDITGKDSLSFMTDMVYFPAISAAKLEISVHNPKRAKHPDGFWDLGDPNSAFLRSLTLEIDPHNIPFSEIRWQESVDAEWQRSVDKNLSILQLNSGGENWNSRNHIDHNQKVVNSPRGYTVIAGQPQNTHPHSAGERATPSVVLNSPSTSLLATLPEFWQRCPSGIEVTETNIQIHLLAASTELTELQPGEKCTRTVWLQLSDRQDQNHENHCYENTVRCVHQPITALPHEAAIVSSNALEWYAPDDQKNSPQATITGTARPNDFEQQLLNEMLRGPTNFLWKREQVDEYGWRNFGDFWADHEELYADDPSPVISHYNNQYDLLHGLLREYLRSQNPQWWDLAKPLAEHIISIDIYDTDRDRAAYNGGLFWHTSHYRDASTASHRTYSRNMVGDKHAVNGGGPSNEHNFTTGLLLYYHLTGSQPAKRAILQLADWVIAMDSGRFDLLAPLTRQTTGAGSSTRDWDYHGPGRGIGNSINALIDAWQLTHADHYLKFCINLIQRCVHPQDDVEALNLNDSENRWSYPIALQALLRFISIVGNHAPETCDYIRQSLLHFGDWMLQHSTMHFDSPEELEFPTETWAAQDLRKGTTLMLIASLNVASPSQNDSCQKMYEKGALVYHEALEKLMSFPSRACTRPAAIALQQFPIRWFAENNYSQPMWVDEQHGEAACTWPDREPVKTQKQEIRQRMTSPTGIAGIVKNACSPSAWIQSCGEFRARFLGRDRFFRVDIRK